MKKKDSGQIQKFRQAARDLGASESEASFNKKLKKIAKAKTVAKPKQKKRAGR